MQIRSLDAAVPGDALRSRALGTEAFGEWPPGTQAPPLPTGPEPGRHEWGAFDGDHLVAKVVWLEHESWFGGRRVPTAGIAGVAVSAEHRGSRLLRPLFEAALGEARAAGYAVSTLYPTASGIYRSLGYEVVSSLDTVVVPTAELARPSRPVEASLRRAEAADLPAVRSVYERWAAAQNGPLTRTGPLFAASDAEVVASCTGISLAVAPDGAVVGYATWRRGSGYGPEATLQVDDLLALTADGYRALWALAASFSSVTGAVRVRTSGLDPARLVLPTATWDVAGRRAYMLAVLDDAAFDQRGAPLPAEVSLSPQGKALLYAGVQNCANLRLLGHLAGPGDHDAALDAALVGRPFHVRDYF